MSPHNPIEHLPTPPIPIADDGDEVHFCTTCAFSGACLAMGYGKPELEELHCLVKHVDAYRAGDHVFRTGEPFRTIFAVRFGTVKTCQIDRDGREQVLGFYLPGEVIGLNAIYPDRFPCDAIALEDSGFCRFSFPAISALATRMPALQQQLFRLISKEVGMASRLSGDYSSDERMAAFLIDLARRYALRGFSGTRFQLSMRRIDIASYLCLTPETVSRVLQRFRNKGLLHIKGRDVTLLAPDKLYELARSALEH